MPSMLNSEPVIDSVCNAGYVKLWTCSWSVSSAIYVESESVVDSDYMKSMLNSSYVLDQFTIYAEA
jgi:hypothetical protein